MWGDFPNDMYSRNRNKEVDNKGDLIMCTVEELEKSIKYNNHNLCIDDIISNNENISSDHGFYS